MTLLSSMNNIITINTRNDQQKDVCLELMHHEDQVGLIDQMTIEQARKSKKRKEERERKQQNY